MLVAVIWLEPGTDDLRVLFSSSGYHYCHLSSSAAIKSRIVWRSDTGLLSLSWNWRLNRCSDYRCPPPTSAGCTLLRNLNFLLIQTGLEKKLDGGLWPTSAHQCLHVSRGSAASMIPRGRAPASPDIFGTPTCAQTVWPGATKFVVITRGGSGVFPGVSHAPIPRLRGPMTATFWDLLHACTQYEKRQPNFAWLSN